MDSFPQKATGISGANGAMLVVSPKRKRGRLRHTSLALRAHGRAGNTSLPQRISFLQRPAYRAATFLQAVQKNMKVAREDLIQVAKPQFAKDQAQLAVGLAQLPARRQAFDGG